MLWFPACYANLASKSDSDEYYRDHAACTCVRGDDKRDMHANWASDKTPSKAAPLVN